MAGLHVRKLPFPMKASNCSPNDGLRVLTETKQEEEEAEAVLCIVLRLLDTWAISPKAQPETGPGQQLGRKAPRKSASTINSIWVGPPCCSSQDHPISWLWTFHWLLLNPGPVSLPISISWLSQFSSSPSKDPMFLMLVPFLCDHLQLIYVFIHSWIFLHVAPLH